MALSKVISFLSTTDRIETTKEPLPQQSVVSEAVLPGHRVRNAMRERASTETLMSQLRDIIVGPQTRINEARFEEMLDILDEQKIGTTGRFETVEQHLGEAADNAVRMTALLESQKLDIAQLKKQMDIQVQELRNENADALDAIQHKIEMKFNIFSEVLEKRLQEMELGLRGEYLELSNTLMAHISDEDKRWEGERESSLSRLEQRIAQWRAEIDDGRTQDRENLGNSMMEIGRRLIALQEP